MSRLRLRELSGRRVVEAVRRRVDDVPDRLAWRLSSRGIANRLKLTTFEDRHRGERCFILANGPGLTRLDLRRLAGEVTFGLNRVYVALDALGIAPTYFVTINELVLEQFAADIARLPIPKFVGWHRRELFEDADDLTFLYSRLSLGDGFERDARQGLYSGGTVTYVTLQLAFFMGFTEVVLVGLDHRWDLAGTPNRTVVAEDTNHFIPGYFPPGFRWQLPDRLRMELAYSRARAAFEASGRRIVDASVDGGCPCFEKESFEAVLAPGRPPL